MANAPTSQKDRPIGFFLSDVFGSPRPDKFVSLWIRPEDLTRTEPSRISTHQTLGSADEASGWVDSFGPGIQTINISGHTGWGRNRAGSDDKDGADRFEELYQEIFVNFHKYRQDAINNGKSPDDVEMIFIDNLDKFACVVAPTGFNLRRSKSRPLLSQYSIGMTVLSQRLGAVDLLNKPSPEETTELGLNSLASSIDSILKKIDDVKNFIDKNILGPVKAFMKMTTDILNKVRSVYSAITGIASSLMNVARSIAQVGRNIFQTLAGIANLPSFIKGELMQVASEYSNVFCLLRNSLKSPEFYSDYTGLYGASNCSSTSGGSPPSIYAGQNPFYAVSPVVVAPVAVSSNAAASLNLLAKSDPVLNPLPTAAIGAHLSTINSGVKLS